MSPEQSGSSKVWRINGLQLHSFVCGFFGWVTWPERFVDLGWGFVSILLWASCLASQIAAMREIGKAYKRRKVVRDFKKKGREQSASTMADEDALKDAGVF
ncbi:hypothetical protein [uncultured Cohaesibacter sp.]|uniref:hypothetical protein n=1 Tax=uncultured Cohaesibacter sp. TaxID=1002546 RepID=UPI00292E7BBF|nr:hypothetical protein [uncultured Cohaesibacter sp.]